MEISDKIAIQKIEPKLHTANIGSLGKLPVELKLKGKLAPTRLCREPGGKTYCRQQIPRQDDSIETTPFHRKPSKSLIYCDKHPLAQPVRFSQNH